MQIARAFSVHPKQNPSAEDMKCILFASSMWRIVAWWNGVHYNALCWTMRPRLSCKGLCNPIF